MNKIGVASMIAGLNRKNSVSQSSSQKEGDTVRNPLYCPTPSPRSSMRKSRLQENIHKPRKAIVKPGSPIRSESKAIAGSPVRQPRSPLTPKDMNSPSRKSAPSKAVPSSPLTTRLHKAAKRQSKRFTRPPSFHMGHSPAVDAPEANTAPKPPARTPVKAPAGVATPFRMLAVPPQVPRNASKQENARQAPVAPPRNTPNQLRRTTRQTSSSALKRPLPAPAQKAPTPMRMLRPKTVQAPAMPEATSQSEGSDDELSETLAKLKKRGAVQVDYTVYQLVNLFTGATPHSRSRRILSCLLEVCPVDQLVRWMTSTISKKDKSNDDRRKAADTLTSVLMASYPNEAEATVAAEVKSALESPQHLAVLIECLKDDDWVLKSYVTGILATLNVSPLGYLSHSEASAAAEAGGSSSGSSENVANVLTSVTNQLQRKKSHGDISVGSSGNVSLKNVADVVHTSANATSTYSYDSLPHIVNLLDNKNSDVREAAITALMCMGPIAGGAVAALTDVVQREKSSKLRVLCLQALKAVGMPFVLVSMDVVQDIAKKDKDEAVKKEAQDLLASLDLLAEGARQMADTSARVPVASKKAALTEELVRDAMAKLCKAKGEVTMKALEKFIEHEHYTVVKDCPRWKAQMRVIVRHFCEKGAVAKKPARFRLL